MLQTPIAQKTEETPAEKIARLEEEIRLFSDFVKSPVWLMLKVQWQPLIDATVGAALGPKAADRSFLAGKVNGMRNFMKYPETHLKKLQLDLKALKVASPQAQN